MRIIAPAKRSMAMEAHSGVFFALAVSLSLGAINDQVARNPEPVRIVDGKK
jgi:hypothetical protein